MPRTARTTESKPFKMKFTFVREIVLDRDIKEVGENDFSRDLVITDANGQKVRVQLKGAKREHLLVKGLGE